MNVESLVKALTSGTALAGFFLVVVVIATVGFGWIKIMRELLDDKDKQIQQKDRELALFRIEKTDLTTRVAFFTKKLAELDNRGTKALATLYWKDKYIGKLEVICVAHGAKLPVNGDSDGD